jgi:hypothetical protein
MLKSPAVWITLILSIATAGSAAAQELETPRRRQGYYIAGGFGSGAVKTWDDGDALPVARNTKFDLRVGQLLTRRLGLGLNVELNAGKRGTVTSSLFGLGFEGQVQLIDNLALRGGVGLAVLQIDDSAIVDKRQHGAYGAQYGLGLSYDWFPFRSDRSGGLAITPSFQIRGLPERVATNLSGFLVVEVSWWTGLPRNQLELPESEAYQKK